MNLFELAAVLTLDKSSYDDGVKDAQGTAEKLSGKIGTALKSVAKVSAATVGAAGAAVGAIVKQSVSEYAEYEQLVGGVNKLFGESADTLMQYAKEAYKTSGLSANEYMEQATSFSAALINSLGGDTEKAAQMADVAMRAMSDNVNTFGSDMGSVQSAFQGFAKQNYTMLDNLKLGYGGTKTEMERLIADANKYAESTGQAANLTIDSYADVVRAIQLVQEQQHIAGTTAKEASTTIQGAIGMTKSAWQNLLTGLSDSEADVNQLVQNLIDSASSVVTNIVPVIKQALSGIGTAVAKIAPELANGVSGIIVDVAPSLLKSAITLIMTLANALLDNADQIIDAAFELIDVLVDSLTDPEGLIKIIDVAFVLLRKLGSGITEALPVLLPAIVSIIMDIADKLTSPENLGTIVDVAVDLLIALADGLISSIGILLDKAPEIVENLVTAIIDNAPKLLSAAGEIVGKFVSGIKDNFGKIVSIGSDIIKWVEDGINNLIPNALSWGKNLISGFINGIKGKNKDLNSSVDGVVATVKNKFTGKSGFDEKSPSRWGKKVFEYLLEGAENGLDAELPSLLGTTKSVVDSVQDTFDNSYEIPSPFANINAPQIESVAENDKLSRQILLLLEKYLPSISNMNVMLDTGALVGEMVGDMDTALGIRAGYATRGAAV